LNTMAKERAETLLQTLHAQGSPIQAKFLAGYLKTSEMEFYGLKLPLIHRIATVTSRGLTQEDLLALASAVWEYRVHEARIAAIDLMERYVKKGSTTEALRAIDRWIDAIDTWAHMDPLASNCLGRLLLRDSSVEDILREWSTSGNFWRRRASVLPYLHLAKKTVFKEEYVPRILSAVEPHITDREFFVGKAAAWVLRELSKRQPMTIRSFVEAHRDEMTPLVLLESTKKL
jgi:3-methyladenine DNA glycosylase AlkD